jgi:hypothetical protein
MSVMDGAWNCTVESPMGAQDFVLTVVSAGTTFAGRAEGGVGAMDVEGEIEGDTLSWPMRVSKPMPITLNCKATVTGDQLDGTVSAGIFGSFPVRGQRAA